MRNKSYGLQQRKMIEAERLKEVFRIIIFLVGKAEKTGARREELHARAAESV